MWPFWMIWSYWGFLNDLKELHEAGGKPNKDGHSPAIPPVKDFTCYFKNIWYPHTSFNVLPDFGCLLMTLTRLSR